MSKISNIKIDQNTYDIRATAIPYGVVDSTSTSTAYTATVPGITELTDGVCCLIKNGKVTSESGFTLNVNGLGAKPSYSNMATGNPVTPTNPTRDTTIFNINYTMLFIYSSTLVDGGAWICYRGYDANTNTIGYQVRSNSHSLPASQKFYRYRLLFTSADGTHYVPANTSSSTNATASRTVNQTPIDPFGHIVYYGTTAAVEANARPAASSLWVIYTLSLGYSFNRTGAALTLDDWAPVYLKCAPQANGSAIIDETTPYVQALPTTADGKIYIFLGVAYSATNIELLNNHPVYYHDGTGIRIWTGKKIATKVSELTNDSGFITSSSLNGYATESYVDNKVPFIANVTISTNPSTGTVTASSITTHAQIKEAVAAGRSVYVKTSIGTVLHLMHINNDEAHFSIVGESSGWMMQQISCTSSNVWSVVNSGLAAVATSGSYNDLTDQPTIPAAVTVDSSLTGSSQTNPVQGGAIYTALQGKENAQKTIIKVLDEPQSDEENLPQFYDVNGNTLSSSQVYTLLADNAKDVYLTFNSVNAIYSLRFKPRSVNYPQVFIFEWTDSELFSTNQIYIDFDNDIWGVYTYTLGNVLSSYVPTSRKINNKALSSDITLTASDVGAMSTSHPANAITSANITEWNWKMSTDYVAIKMTENNGTLSFKNYETDATLTHTQVRTLLNDKTKNFSLHFKYSRNGSDVPTYGNIQPDRQEDYWHFEHIDNFEYTLCSLGWDSTNNEIYIDELIGSYFADLFQEQLVSGTNIKTINNQSLLGSGNITPAQLGVPSIANNLTTTTTGSALDASQGKALKDTVDTKADKVTIVTVSTTGAVTQALDPNKFYNFTGSPTSLTLTLNSGNDLCIYAGKFTAGTGFSNLSFPASVKVADGAPSVEAGGVYEFSVMDNLLLLAKES